MDKQKMKVLDSGKKYDADIVEINHIYRSVPPLKYGFMFSWGVLFAIGSMVLVGRVLIWILDLFSIGGGSL